MLIGVSKGKKGLYSGDHNHCDWGVKGEKRGYIQVITTIVIGVSKLKKGVIVR